MSGSLATFYCPITGGIMNDPVIDPEGNSYEKQAIEDWIRQSSTSPITRTALSIDDLRANRALKEAIEEYRQSNQLVGQSNSLPTIVKSVELTVSGSYVNGFLHVSIQPPKDEHRTPCDICCVVDTSGSMSDRAEIQNDKNEQYGLSQLDLVKHSLKTVIHSLANHDRLSIVSFSDKAEVVLQLVAMNDEGKTRAFETVDNLRTTGSTNLWDGLRTGVEVLSKSTDSIGAISAIFLLTDGCPNINPRDGYIESIQKLKQETNFTCAVNTFGFGYNLNSKLLEDISILGNSGSYAFIPDGSFVGTIFVNAISTLLTTAAANVKILFNNQSLEPTDYTRWYSTNTTDQGTIFSLGSITYGQSKDLLVPFPLELVNNCQLTVTYETAQEKNKSLVFDLKNCYQSADSNLIIRHKFRLEFVNYVRTVFEKMRETKKNSSTPQEVHNEAMGQLKILEENMRIYTNENDEFIKDLFTDLTGQVNEACQRQDWFRRWGVHFLPSLTRAHLLQFCNNFKDPGVQHYGNGTLFSSVRDEMDGIFCGLPAPKRSETGAKIDMTTFYNASGGCFYGDCIIRLMDGTTKLVKDVKPGDRMAPHGGMVNYVIKTKCQNQKAKMVIFENGLIITAWHPIRINQRWIMPCSLVSTPYEIPCETVYNFALEQGHTVLVNDVECVTLGHGFQEDIVRHSYYGSQKVITDLERLNREQNNSGIIEITEKILIRNKQTGLVNGLNLKEIIVQ